MTASSDFKADEEFRCFCELLEIESYIHQQAFNCDVWLVLK